MIKNDNNIEEAMKYFTSLQSSHSIITEALYCKAPTSTAHSQYIDGLALFTAFEPFAELLRGIHGGFDGTCGQDALGCLRQTRRSYRGANC